MRLPHLLMLDPAEGIAVFTDGSCYWKDGSGGWAWMAIDSKGNTVIKSGYERGTTNNRMELHAPAQALQWLHDKLGPIEVLIHSDSQYVVLGSQDRNRIRKKNRDLWTRLDSISDAHKFVEWLHIRGHSGHEYNELVDKLAGEARKNGNG